MSRTHPLNVETSEHRCNNYTTDRINMDFINENISDIRGEEINVDKNSVDTNNITKDEFNELEPETISASLTFDKTEVKTAKGDNPHETSQCPKHAGYFLQYFCSQCNKIVCEKCSQTDHAGHTTVAVSEVAVEHRESLAKLLSKFRLMNPEIERALMETEDALKQLMANTADAEGKIVSLFDELATIVEERKQRSLTELTHVSASRENALHRQKQSLSHKLKDINICCEFMERVIHRGSDSDVVTAKTQVGGKLPDLISQSLHLQPETKPIVLFDEHGFDALKKVVCCAHSLDNNTAVPLHTSADGEALSCCIVGKFTIVTVTTRDRNGDLVKTGFSPLTAYIVSDKQENIINPTIINLHDGTYDIRFLLSETGIYYLNVLMYDQHIKDSPYRIRAVDALDVGESDCYGTSKTLVPNENCSKRSDHSRSHSSCSRLTRRVDDDLILKVGVRGRNKGEFSNPQGICCHDDKIVVADSSNQSVQVFGLSGEFYLKFGAPGCCPGKIQRPTGVAVNQSGNYLVADYDKKWISEFTPDGRYISHVGAGNLQGPKGVVVDRDDHIIVVDNKCNCVLVFQPNGRLVNKFGNRGPWTEQLAGPHYAAVNDDCDIIVTDFHNHCVKVYDKNGKFKFTFGSNGEGNGQFNAPTGVAVDEKNNILVADWGNSRIQVFDSSGSFLSFVNTSSDPLSGPQGLAVMSQGVVVVADSGNHCIKYYKYLQ